jgi:hypothetical protein
MKKQLVHWLSVFIVLCFSFWVAGMREPKDGFRYFATAAVVSVVLWVVYYFCLHFFRAIRAR